MQHNGKLYVFGFANTYSRLNERMPFGKTDIYKMLVAGGFNHHRPNEALKKEKRSVGVFTIINFKQI